MLALLVVLAIVVGAVGNLIPGPQLRGVQRPTREARRLTRALGALVVQESRRAGPSGG